MIVVQTRTSYSPSQKSTTTCSRLPSSIWPWATAIRASGTRSAEVLRDLFDVGDAVVHEEDLALPQELAADGLGNGAFVVLADVGEDRLAVRRRGLEQRQVPDAGEAHLEGPGIGVAVSVRTSTSVLNCLICSL